MENIVVCGLWFGSKALAWKRLRARCDNEQPVYSHRLTFDGEMKREGKENISNFEHVYGRE
jgi:hypothetical protein